jgi:hypothetical protein
MSAPDDHAQDEERMTYNIPTCKNTRDLPICCFFQSANSSCNCLALRDGLGLRETNG